LATLRATPPQPKNRAKGPPTWPKPPPARDIKPGQALGPTSLGRPKGKFRLGFKPSFVTQGKTKKRKTITHSSSSEQCPQSVPMVRSVSEIMALLRPPKENTPPRRDPVEPPPPMMELSLYSIVSDYEDQEYFNCMMSE
ncbi:unnamed protein product, partial [Prunus brigantina]